VGDYVARNEIFVLVERAAVTNPMWFLRDRRVIDVSPTRGRVSFQNRDVARAHFSPQERTMVATASESHRMKALVQDGSGSADVLHLREIEPPAVTDDDVLVKVHAASVNALDYHIVHGAMIVRMIGKLLRRSRPNPIRGVDVAGVVEAVGKNVTTCGRAMRFSERGQARGPSTRKATSAASCRSPRVSRSSRPALSVWRH
jgi:hypothetical protein